MKLAIAIAILTATMGGCVIVPYDSGYRGDGYSRGDGDHRGDGYYRDGYYRDGNTARGTTATTVTTGGTASRNMDGNAVGSRTISNLGDR